jgi:hypothetical protein
MCVHPEQKEPKSPLTDKKLNNLILSLNYQRIY